MRNKLGVLILFLILAGVFLFYSPSSPISSPPGESTPTETPDELPTENTPITEKPDGTSTETTTTIPGERVTFSVSTNKELLKKKQYKSSYKRVTKVNTTDNVIINEINITYSLNPMEQNYYSINHKTGDEKYSNGNITYVRVFEGTHFENNTSIVSDYSLITSKEDPTVRLDTDRAMGNTLSIKNIKFVKNGTTVVNNYSVTRYDAVSVSGQVTEVYSDEMNRTSFDSTIYVRDDGLIVKVMIDQTFSFEDTETKVMVIYEVSDVGETTVTEPEWVEFLD